MQLYNFRYQLFKRRKCDGRCLDDFGRWFVRSKSFESHELAFSWNRPVVGGQSHVRQSFEKNGIFRKNVGNQRKEFDSDWNRNKKEEEARNFSRHSSKSSRIEFAFWEKPRNPFLNQKKLQTLETALKMRNSEMLIFFIEAEKITKR